MIFYKTVSAGNDFIHIEQDVYPPLANKAEKSRLVRQLCRRHLGAGADGVVFYRIPLLNPDKTNRDDAAEPVSFEIFNRDGGEAELSGNGMAGLTALLFHLDLENQKEKHNEHLNEHLNTPSPQKDSVVLNTRAGRKQNLYISHQGNTFRLKIEIGEPDFQQREFFPFLKEERKNYSFGGVTFYPVSVGNPHAVVILEKYTSDERLREIGEMLESADIFPFKTNVEIVVPTGNDIDALTPAEFESGENFKVYYYERGVGPTLASSTGSAAVFSVLRKLKMIDHLLILPPTDDGDVIRISGKQKVYIENSTKIVYKGVYLSD